LSALWRAQPSVEEVRAETSAARIALVRVDAGLRAAVPPDELPSAERVLTVPWCELGRGSWAPEALVADGARPFAALVLRGVVTCEITLAGRSSAQLLGPGDLLRPWRSVDTSVPCASAWRAAGGAAVALLDDRFLLAARRWPRLAAVVYERLSEQVEIGAVRAAIVALPRVEQRVVALFWHLADRWGVVRPEGVIVRLALTHELIGRLVGAQRPTVSLALHTLAEQGFLRRDDADGWILRSDSGAMLASIADSRFRNGSTPR
jgi:CRP/FNR family cyclic AMP-dependent transcriptional regulator